jgi:deoxyadenosine/deoxycytidine kinase
MIIFEGIIGSGKSRASRSLFVDYSESPTLGIEEDYNAVYTHGNYALFPEPVGSNPYLEDFYKDPGRWALEMQFYLLTRRFQMHENAIRMEWDKRMTTIFDRSIYGDRAFAYLLWQDGLISGRGYANYEKHFNCMARFLLVPQDVFYLDVSIPTALARIAKRGRECEKGIPSDYLEKLDKAYKKIVLPDLGRRGARVQVIDWNRDTNEQEVLSLCSKL